MLPERRDRGNLMADKKSEKKGDKISLSRRIVMHKSHDFDVNFIKEKISRLVLSFAPFTRAKIALTLMMSQGVSTGASSIFIATPPLSSTLHGFASDIWWKKFGEIFVKTIRKIPPPADLVQRLNCYRGRIWICYFWAGAAIATLQKMEKFHSCGEIEEP